MTGIRVGGLASGIDTDQMVNKLMKAERIPLNKMEQDQTWTTWKRDAYRDINKLLLDFKNKAFNMSLSQPYNARNVSSSNSSLIDATATNNADLASYTISAVDQLATAATMVTGDNALAGIDVDQPLGELGIVSGDGATLTINDTDIKVGKDDTIQDLIGKINKADDGVTALFDKESGKISLTATGTGSNHEINIGGDSDFVQQLGLDNPDINLKGKDAKFTINNMEMTRHSNSFDINGVNVQLKKIFSADDTSPVRLDVTNDTDAVMDKITDFVDQYNELIDKVNDKLKEERYRDYKPLTDKQREDMSEHEQKLWEEKAKSGLLARDSTLSSVLSEMRMDFYSPVKSGDDTSVSQQLASIGIETTANYLDGGKLEIDEDKLRKAIDADPGKVQELFTANGDSYEQKGIMQRLSDTVKGTIDTIHEKAGKPSATNNTYSMGRNLNDMKEQISSFKDHLQKVETRYWKQFTAMEKAIQKMNSQSDYMMSMMGGGN